MQRSFRWVAWATVVACVCSGAVPSMAQDSSPGEDYSQGLLDRDAVIEASREVTPERFPNADDVLVDDHVRVRYRADGTYVTWDDTYLKVLTEKGKRKNQTLSVHFTIPYSRYDDEEKDVAITVLELIKPDGTLVPVDVEELSRVMIDPSGMGSNIYNPNSKILQATIPGLDIGDMVHYVTHRKVRQPRVRDVWADLNVFEYTSPLKHLIYEVFGPRDAPLRSSALKDEIPGTVTYTMSERDDQLVYRWEVRDVPRMFEEPSMPGLTEVVQRLLVSTAPDWETISRWYWELSEPHYDTTPAMERKVAELTTGLSEPQARIEALFRWVSQEVRYMGITTEAGAPGYEPHDVAETFTQRHGVCRDKAALLVALLRLDGFKAWPVLIMQGPTKKDSEVPLPWFNHAIVCVEKDDGSYMLMDPTDESTKEILPPYLNDKSYLVAKPEGETLRTSPIVPAEENLMRISTTGVIDAAGKLTAESSFQFEGINDNGYRGYFAQIAPEQRRQYFEAALKNVISGALITDLSILPDNMLDTSRPLQVTMSYEAEDVLVSGDHSVMLPVPRLGTRVGWTSFVLRGNTGLEKREYPLKTTIACGVEETIRLDLPPSLGEVVAMPRYPQIDNDAISWMQRDELSADAAVLTGATRFLLKAVEFSPEQYLTLKQALKERDRSGYKMPIFARAEDETGALSAASYNTADHEILIIEQCTEYDVRDAHNWTHTVTVTKKILSYAGKKKNSELKIHYNPAWEEVVLEYGRVIAPDGSVQEIRTEEQNVMDAPWVGSAPRYPASKILVASLPGVEIGSTIEYRVVTRCIDHPFFAARVGLSGMDPAGKLEVMVSYPSELDIDADLDTNGFAYAEGVGIPAPEVREEHRTQGDRSIRRWTILQPDVIKREDSVPPLDAFIPTVTAHAGEWRAYGNLVRDVLVSNARGQRAAGQRAKDLVRGLKTPELKLRTIRDFVARNIREAGPRLDEIPLTGLSKADVTLQEGYGNSADRATLLYAMLAEGEFDPEFVLTSSRVSRVRSLQEAVREDPDARWFDEVLVRVAVNGKYTYFNDSDQYAVLGATPHEERVGLVTHDGEFIRILSRAGREDKEELVTIVHLAESGDATIRKIRRVYGSSYAAAHKKYAEMPPEERARHHQGLLTSLAEGALAEGGLITDFDTYPGRVEFSARVTQFGVRDGDFLYFQLPESLDRLMRLRGDARETPYYRDTHTRQRIVTVVVLPDEFTTIELRPADLLWVAPQNSGAVEVSTGQWVGDTAIPPELVGLEMDLSGIEGRAFWVVHDADLEAALIDAADYPELLEIMRRLSCPAARTVLLSESPRG
ncbi:DUF3857 domain-containing protein [Candidatus Fermentibacteria bacterium]|nr:DUF3857 domain-containing protein [Candidatus Fermentibacteria bacterium]